MHLKNFSLLEYPGIGMALSPAYDLVATALVNPADEEDLALTLNGKKKRIKKSDFLQAFDTLQLETRQQQNILAKMAKAKALWMKQIDLSFLSHTMKARYEEILEERFSRME